MGSAAVGDEDAEGAALAVVGAAVGEPDGAGVAVGDTPIVGDADADADGEGLGTGLVVADGDGVVVGSGDAEGLVVGSGDAEALADGSADGEADGDPDAFGVGLAEADPVGEPLAVGTGLGAPGPESTGVPSPVPLTPSWPPVASLSGCGSPPTVEGRSSALVTLAWPRTRVRVPDWAGTRAGATLAPTTAPPPDSARGTVGAAARVGMGSSWASGSARIRLTSAAESTSTGSSATTWRTVPTVVSPTAAAPAATAAHAAMGIQRGVMSNIVHLWVPNAALSPRKCGGCPPRSVRTGAIP